MGFYNQVPAARRDAILYQGSSHSHFSWHLHGRAACADGYADVKKNVDHAITNYPSWFRNLMPLDIGWYALGQEKISESDIEYVLCRSVGWESSVGFSTSLEALESNPRTPAMLDLVATYEKLRLARHFPEEVREKLRRPGEYHLQPEGDGWKFVAPGER